MKDVTKMPAVNGILESSKEELLKMKFLRFSDLKLKNRSCYAVQADFCYNGHINKGDVCI